MNDIKTLEGIILSLSLLLVDPVIQYRVKCEDQLVEIIKILNERIKEIKKQNKAKEKNDRQ